MITVFLARPYGRFIEVKSNFGRKKLRRTNQACNFLGGSFRNRDDVSVVIQFRRERQSQQLKKR